MQGSMGLFSSFFPAPIAGKTTVSNVRTPPLIRLQRDQFPTGLMIILTLHSLLPGLELPNCNWLKTAALLVYVFLLAILYFSTRLTLVYYRLLILPGLMQQCKGASIPVWPLLNLHPWLNDTDGLMANQSGYADKVAAYWKTIGAYFKKYPADKLFFEVYNEPHASSGGPGTTLFLVAAGTGKMINAIRRTRSHQYTLCDCRRWRMEQHW